MSVRLGFLGGTGTVSGSKYLVEAGKLRILVDCGLLRGYKQLRLRNWAPLPVDSAEINAVIMTNAHLDHWTDLPVLTRVGFNGNVACTAANTDGVHLFERK